MATQLQRGERKAEIVNFRRRQDRSFRTREKIVRGALTEFASGGFDGATTRSIAKRAAVPHASVIYHYETKLGVWQAVVEHALSEMRERFAETVEKLAGDDPELMARTLYRHYITTAAALPEVTWVLMHEISGRSERLEWLLDRIQGEDLEMGIGLIKQLQAEGRFIEGDPAHLHFLMIGVASRFFSMAPEIERRMGISPFDPDLVERHIALCESLFFGPPRGKSVDQADKNADKSTD